ncbi:MAG: LysR family transcriptional regulator [Oscillospiraceae bacterium]|nr:LysR family transcriptional regulator [Oscillospiraceae bacterium]
MTHPEIEAFLTVIRLGSITAAAKQLYITQPALSRRLYHLEEELGYLLLRRQKGQRTVELTEEGKAFVPVAENWQRLWQESRRIAHLGQAKRLNLAVLGSVNSYLMSPVYRDFLRENPAFRLSVTDQHSSATYELVANGEADLGIISDERYLKGVRTVPLFREKMVLVAKTALGLPETVHPQQLDPSLEVRLPWFPECDRWHEYWFGAAIPHVYIDQMPLLEDFLQAGAYWCVLPESVACRLLKKEGLHRHRLQSPPPERIIYYLLGHREDDGAAELFLKTLRRHLEKEEALQLL